MLRKAGSIGLVIALDYAGAGLLQLVLAWGLLAPVIVTVLVTYLACGVARGSERQVATFSATLLFAFAIFWDPLHGRALGTPVEPVGHGCLHDNALVPADPVIAISVADVDGVRGKRETRGAARRSGDAP